MPEKANSQVFANVVARLGLRLNSFHDGLRLRLEQSSGEIAQYERQNAERFNVFTYIKPNENRLSDILAGLLDPKGTHGQGDIYLRLLVNRLQVVIPEKIRFIRVEREEATDYIANQRRKVDILLDFRTYGFGIENKPWALDQIDQIQDYILHLERRYDNFVLLYLSGNGEPPASLTSVERKRREKRNQFRVLDYGSGIIPWLSECIDASEAERMRYFLLDFRSYIIEQFGDSDSFKKG